MSTGLFLSLLSACHWWLRDVDFDCSSFCKMDLGLDELLIQHQMKSFFFFHLWFSGSQVDQCLYDASQQKGWKLHHALVARMDLQ